ncbi:heparan sulfate 2-O-sulfotransferase 1 [Protobothrops mucrosquamatus]|nr:heparan sulfate 2-O-sulfotransferase 1 [Protobothrops mucrosquamatus]
MADSPGQSITQSGGHPPSGSPMAPVSRLALERSCLSRQLCSTGVINIIQASRRPSTNRIYESSWRNFQSWYSRKQLSLAQITIPHILEYLLEGLERGLAPNTLRRQVAALSTVLSCDSVESLGRHPLIRSFLKGAANTRPPTVHRYPSWDLPRVLRALTRPPFEPMRSCDLQHLAHKVAFLVAITSARRISELAALSVRKDLCFFRSDRVVLRLDPTFIPKVNSTFHRNQDIVLPDFCPNPSCAQERQWHSLDVRRALSYYISRTADLQRAIAKHEVREIEQRHTVDGSRSDLIPDEDDDVVIIYNRVPKTASTSFTNIAYDLCAKNKYHVLHINTTKNNPVMSLQDQVRFVKNITSWKEMKPGFYHGHISFLDFAKFGVKKKPIYINVIRDPIERLVSYYYFLRFGDDYRPGLRRRKQGDKKTFDECVAAGGSDCAPEKLWLQIPFFCGHSSECWNVGSRWALEQAKYNLINEYFLVGVTEELEDFIMLLEAALPRFFRGATELYRTGKKSHLRKTTEKKLPSKETIAKLQQSEIWKMENEFYEFALEQFQFVRAHAVREKDGELYILAQNFFYEKIYPKSN